MWSFGQLSLARPGQSPVTSASSDSSDSLPKTEDISGRVWGRDWLETPAINQDLVECCIKPIQRLKFSIRMYPIQYITPLENP